jgi:uncharacterized membrane protein
VTNRVERRVLQRLFLISIGIKGAVGLLQVVAGSILLSVSQSRLVAIAVLLTSPELAEDPRDPIALFLRHSADQLDPGTQTFASFYLVTHGLIKIVLVAGLLRRQMWSYPASLWVLGAFVAYQCYRYMETHSIWLVLLTALDIVVILLVWREYRLRKRTGFAC